MSMMNVKRSTQAFSSAKQESSLKSERVQSESATDFQKAYGDQNVGEVLNKIADPNWVDPSKKIRSVGNNELGKDAFLKLMLTQMKNQDPTKPMESHEMASQLAQFTSLEQLNNINTTLDAMKNAQNPNSSYQALALMGKKVSGDSSKLTRVPGDTKHAFSFDLMNDAIKAKISIKDAAGNVVRSLEMNNLKKGKSSIDWNGLTDQGLPARPGEYKFAVEATASSGQKVYAKTSFEGRITGLNYTAEGPVLLVGDKTIKLSEVRKIEEPGPQDLAPQTPLSVGAKAKPAVKPEQAKEHDNIPPAEELDPKDYGNIDSVPMASSLLSKVSKEAGNQGNNGT